MKKKLLIILSCLFVAFSAVGVFSACETGTPPDIKPETKTYSVTYEEVEGVKYSNDNPTSVQTGERVAISFELSVFYKAEEELPVVTVNERERNVSFDEEEGIYSVTISNVSRDLAVSVSGVVKAESKLASSGNGTEESPFLIQEPIDLIFLAEEVNSGNSSLIGNTAYFTLENSLDLRGEELQIIGDGSTNTSCFAGVFNGKGNTISNFVINSSNSDNVGLFGVVQAYDGNFSNNLYGGTITNLTIENFTIIAKSNGGTLICGSLIGQSYGAVLSLCNAVNGNIEIFGDASHFAYAGGLVGLLASYSYPFFSSVSYCHTDVEVNCNSGTVYVAGGVVGYVYSNDETVVATINNCYSTGNVSGSFYAGGVVGYLCNYTGVVNCYSTGNVSAQTTITDTVNLEMYCHAYSGGIVAMAQTDSVIADSFATGVLSSAAKLGPDYSHTGGTVASADDASTGEYGSNPATVYNCYYVENGKNSEIDLTKTSELKSKLHWHEFDWNFSDGAYPVIDTEVHEEKYSFTVKLDFGSAPVKGENGENIDYTEMVISEAYKPMSFWYLINLGENGTNGIPQSSLIKGENGYSAYGYYFDDEYTQAVPFGYIPTRDITLYVGFADNNKVADSYYLLVQSETGDMREVILTLESNGEFKCKDPTGDYSGVYKYNGKNIIFTDANFARYCYAKNLDAQGSFIFKADITESGLSIIGGRYTDADSSSVVQMITDDNPLIAVKISNAVIGSYYYKESDKVLIYTFFANGKGTTNDYDDFTYKINQNQISLTLYGETIDGELSNGDLVKLNGKDMIRVDKYAGEYRVFALSDSYYEFDGAGNYSYIYYNGRNNQTRKGTYKLVNEGESIELSNGLTACFNENGMLVFSGDSVTYTYGNTESYFGKWTTEDKLVTITFNGIGKEGSGNAKILFLSEEDGISQKEIYELTYSEDVMTENAVYLYNSNTIFGMLSYSKDGISLSGKVYNVITSSYDEYVFYRADEYEGEWIGNSEFKIVNFNGYGSYTIGSVNNLKGTLTVNGENASYTLDELTLTGSVIYNKQTYKLTYDIGTGKITIGEETLVRKDVLGDLTFIDENGKEYFFDGKGVLDTKGLLKVTENGSSTEYKYVIGGTDAIATIYGDEETSIGSINLTSDGKNYQIELKGNTSVIREKTVFTGKWALNYAYGRMLEIGTMNLDGTMSGKLPLLIDDVNVVKDTVFTLVDGDYLTCTVSVISGSVTESQDFYVINVAENAFVVSTYLNWFNYDSEYLFATTPDVLFGTWENKHTGDEYIFDGMGIFDTVYGRVVNKQINSDDSSIEYFYGYYERTDKSGFDFLIFNQSYGSIQKVNFNVKEDEKDVYVNTETGTKFGLVVITSLDDYIIEGEE